MFWFQIYKCFNICPQIHKLTQTQKMSGLRKFYKSFAVVVICTSLLIFYFNQNNMISISPDQQGKVLRSLHNILNFTKCDKEELSLLDTVQRTFDQQNSTEHLRYLDKFVLDSLQKRESVTQLLNAPIINNFSIEFQVDQYNKCLAFDPELILITPSHIANFDRRYQTRFKRLAGFRKHNYKTAVHVFVVGLSDTEDETVQQKLEEEITKYGDIVQTKTLDIYKNILYKHIAMMTWVREFCPRATFVLRIDDDVTLDPSKALHALRRYRQKHENFILGKKRDGDSPYRSDRVPKWYVSREEYPSDEYPPYVLGGAIGYPVSTVDLLYAAAHRLKTLWLDDVFVTGVCAHALGIPRYNDMFFQFKH